MMQINAPGMGPWTAGQFVGKARIHAAAMTDACRDFGVSRKTGYKIFDRYREHGSAALSDRNLSPDAKLRSEVFWFTID
jgi:hypothetical protein